MHLKSLELNGFKSFASKTVLEFPKGITAIVGPNGSGKSNIIDSIRWLLGERDAKNIRGEKMENLIFAGTPKKPKMAMASVGVFFDNNSGFFPVDFGEISVVRKVARDGVSRYFLNKSETKLKEVVDFFSRARLGTKGLTIINQGSSDLFVRAGAEERKAMIDEVLGLKEFQIKKNEAERKLKNTGINLERVRAMLEEVVPRMKMLNRQMGKWEKRAEMAKELKELEDGYFSFKIGEIIGEKKKIEPRVNELSGLIGIKSGELKILEDKARGLEIKSGRRDFSGIKSRKNELLDKNLELQKRLSRIEVKLEILSGESGGDDSFEKEELANLVSDVKNSLEEILKFGEFGAVVGAVEKLVEKIKAFLSRPKDRKKRELDELEESKKSLIKEISAIESEIKKLEFEETEASREMEEFNKNFKAAFGEIESKKEEIRKLNDKKHEAVFEMEKFVLRLGDLEKQISATGRTMGEFKPDMEEAAGGRENRDLATIERKMFRLRGEIAGIGEIDESLVEEAKETNERYNFLSSQISDLEKASDDLEVLIRELKEKIHDEFGKSFHLINENFNKYFRLMFEGGNAKLRIKNNELRIKDNDDDGDGKNNNDSDSEENGKKEEKIGVEIDLNLPKKKITSLEMLSGGEKSLVSIAALFALISVSPPPFLVLDEVDAALDEKNSKRFANLIKEFSHKTQFIIVTHNRMVMESADVLYGVTMNEDGTSKLLSLKFRNRS